MGGGTSRQSRADWCKGKGRKAFQGPASSLRALVNLFTLQARRYSRVRASTISKRSQVVWDDWEGSGRKRQREERMEGEQEQQQQGGLEGGEGEAGLVRIGKRVYIGNLAWKTSWQDLKVGREREEEVRGMKSGKGLKMMRERS